MLSANSRSRRQLGGKLLSNHHLFTGNLSISTARLDFSTFSTLFSTKHIIITVESR